MMLFVVEVVDGVEELVGLSLVVSIISLTMTTIMASPSVAATASFGLFAMLSIFNFPR